MQAGDVFHFAAAVERKSVGRHADRDSDQIAARLTPGRLNSYLLACGNDPATVLDLAVVDENRILLPVNRVPNSGSSPPVRFIGTPGDRRSRYKKRDSCGGLALFDYVQCPRETRVLRSVDLQRAVREDFDG